ncbi:hypothetical protein LZ31DRAFT_292528 [Colletotrichum somersetense]|nr:hypothetical protein LZ31DRAFT_292528 [Colletotrichum somersetense]
MRARHVLEASFRNHDGLFFGGGFYPAFCRFDCHLPTTRSLVCWKGSLSVPPSVGGSEMSRHRIGGQVPAFSSLAPVAVGMACVGATSSLSLAPVTVANRSNSSMSSSQPGPSLPPSSIRVGNGRRVKPSPSGGPYALSGRRATIWGQTDAFAAVTRCPRLGLMVFFQPIQAFWNSEMLLSLNREPSLSRRGSTISCGRRAHVSRARRGRYPSSRARSVDPRDAASIAPTPQLPVRVGDTETRIRVAILPMLLRSVPGPGKTFWRGCVVVGHLIGAGA